MLNYMDEVHVILHDKTRLVAQVIGMDPATHVAVLKVDAFDLPVMSILHRQHSAVTTGAMGDVDRYAYGVGV